MLGMSATCAGDCRLGDASTNHQETSRGSLARRDKSLRGSLTPSTATPAGQDGVFLAHQVGKNQGDTEGQKKLRAIPGQTWKGTQNSSILWREL